MTNSQIVKENYELIRTCCEYQTSKYKVSNKLLDDLVQDICLILLEYDNVKLSALTRSGHINAFVTGILVRQLFSRNSAFYRTYVKFDQMTDELEKKFDLPDEDA